MRLEGSPGRFVELVTVGYFGKDAHCAICTKPNPLR
jgi:hypothetical protein